jgi:hypothetical protein
MIEILTKKGPSTQKDLHSGILALTLRFILQNIPHEQKSSFLYTRL